MISFGSSYEIIEIIAANSEGLLDIEIDSEPIGFEIVSVYPNPFNPISNIEFSLSQESDVYINIFNINGQLVENNFYSKMCEGAHLYSWDASNMSSGIYFAQIKTNYGSLTHKLTLVK